MTGQYPPGEEESDPNLLCIFVSLEADKAKSLRFTTLISHDPDTECRSYKTQQPDATLNRPNLSINVHL